MSVDRGEAEIICSFRVFRILTHLGHGTAAEGPSWAFKMAAEGCISDFK
jgi:hypothetical protein